MVWDFCPPYLRKGGQNSQKFIPSPNNAGFVYRPTKQRLPAVKKPAKSSKSEKINES
jgi:hypothetical protein